MQILLSRTQAEPGRTGKQEQEQTSRNHVQTIFGSSVNDCNKWPEITSILFMQIWQVELLVWFCAELAANCAGLTRCGSWQPWPSPPSSSSRDRWRSRCSASSSSPPSRSRRRHCSPRRAASADSDLSEYLTQPRGKWSLGRTRSPLQRKKGRHDFEEEQNAEINILLPLVHIRYWFTL